MYDFSQVSVRQETSKTLTVENGTEYPMIAKGAHGAVFKMNEDQCVKIYADKRICEIEGKAYAAAQDSTIVPRLYETGDNYIIMEYIDGPSLDAYLRKKGRVPTQMAKQFIFVIREMERLGFERRDAALRHLILNKYKELKVIDIVKAYTHHDPIPVRFLKGLKKLNLVEDFVEKLRKIDIDLYWKWGHALSEYMNQKED